MASQVFISHASADRAAANQVRQALESAGIHCWIAPRDIVPGKDWGEAIVDALSECRVMVLIFSASANDSKEVRREVQCAFESDVSVVPLRVEQVSPAKGLQYYLNSVHWLDAVPLGEEDLRGLTETVRRHLEATAAGAREAGSVTVTIPAAVATAVMPATHAPPATGPLAYATPLPVRRSRHIAWVAIITLGLVAAAFLVGGYARYEARRAPLQAAIAARSVPPGTMFAPVPVTPLKTQGTRAASEILDDLGALDDHTGTFTRTLDAGPGDAELKALRDLADARDAFKSYYNTFGTTHGSAGSASSPVRDRVAALGVLGAKPETVRRFADDLFVFRQAERDLLARLEELIHRGTLMDLAAQLGFDDAGKAADAVPPSDGQPTTSATSSPAAEPEKHRAYARRALAAEAAELRARAAIAHSSGLRLLGELGGNQSIGTAAKLSALKNLGPSQPLSGPPLDALEAQASTQVEQTGADRSAAAEEGERLWRQTLEAWSARLMPPFKLSGRPPEQTSALLAADLPDPYRPSPDSSPAAAAAQAASARRDGWDSAALVLYFLYAGRFAPTDPAAEDYARAAVQYTLQYGRLGLSARHGALYVVGVTSAAGDTGGDNALRPGDVLLTYADRPVGDANELSAAVKEVPPGQPVQLEFLRRDDKGLFARRTVTLPQGGPVQAVFRPL